MRRPPYTGVGPAFGRAPLAFLRAYTDAGTIRARRIPGSLDRRTGSVGRYVPVSAG
jgi:hypothetical protein